jgi:hypothetical protein
MLLRNKNGSTLPNSQSTILIYCEATPKLVRVVGEYFSDDAFLDVIAGRFQSQEQNTRVRWPDR